MSRAVVKLVQEGAHGGTLCSPVINAKDVRFPDV
jgi:hypothetical protein